MKGRGLRPPQFDMAEETKKPEPEPKAKAEPKPAPKKLPEEIDSKKTVLTAHQMRMKQWFGSKDEK